MTKNKEEMRCTVCGKIIGYFCMFYNEWNICSHCDSCRDPKGKTIIEYYDSLFERVKKGIKRIFGKHA